MFVHLSNKLPESVLPWELVIESDSSGTLGDIEACYDVSAGTVEVVIINAGMSTF